MFQFGDKVIVLDKELKSFKKVGLYCGKNDKGLAKVYLKDPIQTKSTNVHCITVGEDKIALWSEDGAERIKTRLDYLSKALDKINQERTAILNEMYELENELLLGARET